MSDDQTPVSVRHFPPTNRLADMIQLPGGRTVQRALQEAEAAIQQYRPEVVEDIDLRITELERLAGAEATQTVRDAIYKAASAILEHAGLFGLADVGKAAYSLCDLVDRLGDRGAWDAAAVAVHVGSIRLLRDLTDDQALQRAQLLKGLHAVVLKVAAEGEAAKAAVAAT